MFFVDNAAALFLFIGYKWRLSSYFLHFRQSDAALRSLRLFHFRPDTKSAPFFCTCSCGLFFERAQTPTFEVCLPPERVQSALDGVAFSQREVHNYCNEICRNGMAQGARNYSCEQGQEPCEGPFCVDCRAIPLDEDRFFFEETLIGELDGGVGLISDGGSGGLLSNEGNEGGVDGGRGDFGVGLGTRSKDESGEQFSCDVEECAQDVLFTPRCGDQILQVGEVCDGACGTFPATCDIPLEVSTDKSPATEDSWDALTTAKKYSTINAFGTWKRGRSDGASYLPDSRRTA
ncbi:MAG: hypothetical protein GY822_32930 [Deltaproteobacteria bacterium]|nr:hypothetical protein [Deltaproteobacteria bacterium]